MTGEHNAGREEAFDQCNRWLSGHGPQRPRAVLAALADATAAEEEPDRYGQGVLIEAFEREIATLLGMEASVFLPSGTMAQQIALRVWADRRRCQTVAFHPTCHLELRELKGYALLHGLQGQLVGERTRLLTSFYKGVGAIAGAALAGPADFIAEARPWQRRHGGNLVQLYPYVLSASVNLRRRLPRFTGYRQRAQAVARVLSSIPGIAVRPNPPHTNMMHVYLPGTAESLLAASAAVARSERVLLFRRLIPTDVPGVAAFELSIGDGAEVISDEEIGAYFRHVMDVAGV